MRLKSLRKRKKVQGTPHGIKKLRGPPVLKELVK